MLDSQPMTVREYIETLPPGLLDDAMDIMRQATNAVGMLLVPHEGTPLNAPQLVSVIADAALQVHASKVSDIIMASKAEEN